MTPAKYIGETQRLIIHEQNNSVKRKDVFTKIGDISSI